MNFGDLRHVLATRLDQGNTGDRGWSIATRVHPALRWLKGIAEYIEARGYGKSVTLGVEDYQQLAMIVGTKANEPSLILRRHHLLIMDKPLQLLRRVNGNSWEKIELTRHGLALARSVDPAVILETVLSDIHFAADPWCSASRERQYAEFDVKVYEAAKRVLDRCEGYIDRDEFDFFVSRIRHMGEVDWAVKAIKKYRALSSEKQAELHSEVRSRLANDKAYDNWRDVGLHTFTLFSLGTSMVREETYLRLTANWAACHVEQTSSTTVPELKMPAPTDSQTLLTPPSAKASNDGTDAESFVAKVFRSQGWAVIFYTNRRGFGFDLWARKNDAAILIEVKSSVGDLGSIAFTENEYLAARKHGENFVLAVVEQLASDNPRLRLITNPAVNLKFTKRSATVYTTSREQWFAVT